MSCLTGFTKKSTYDKHKCEECCEGVLNKRLKKIETSSKIGKDLNHYLNNQAMKGGKKEVSSKIENFIKTMSEKGVEVDTEEIEIKTKMYEDNINYQKYIVYDFEADVSTETHKLNHVEADVLITNDDHSYKECKIDTFSHNGYDVVDKFCNWLFTEKTCIRPFLLIIKQDMTVDLFFNGV